jgi:hypothetical protein
MFFKQRSLLKGLGAWAQNHSMNANHLGTYLNDHFAGSVAALELFKRLKSANAGTPRGEVFADLLQEIEQDQIAMLRLRWPQIVVPRHEDLTRSIERDASPDGAENSIAGRREASLNCRTLASFLRHPQSEKSRSVLCRSRQPLDRSFARIGSPRQTELSSVEYLGLPVANALRHRRSAKDLSRTSRNTYAPASKDRLLHN